MSHSGSGPNREAQARQRLIDPRLETQGWRLVRHTSAQHLAEYTHHAVAEFPTDHGPADYALIVDGRVLGIVEAKRSGLAPQEVLTQAERYARGLTDSPFDFDGLRAPFIYSTNGQLIWFRDVRHPLNRARPIADFHTPRALSELLGRDFEQGCRDLAGLPNDHPRLRPYQLEATQAIEQAITQRKRRMLVAMATGTGKTLTTVSLIYRLLRAGVGQRVLFLVDRRSLAAQALQAFASFEAERGYKFTQLYEVYSQRLAREDFDGDFDPKLLPLSALQHPRPGQTFVYVSTIQRLAVNIFGRDIVPALGDEPIDDDVEQVPIPIDAFDLVIADECHRGYTGRELSVWRNTLDHFDAITIGLTATPAAHTMSYFQELVFRYDYRRAVQDGYLVDYDVVAVGSDVRLNGVFLGEGEQVKMVDTATGDTQLDFLEAERQFDASEVERRITVPDSNRKILAEVKTFTDQHEARTGRFPKTLIFAVNDLPHASHADALVKIARDLFGRGDAFVQKITGQADRPLQRIREFRNRPEPGVVVSVDLLTTGVDIPNLEFIVLLRTVKSRILFEQMLGRGTRLGDLQPPKTHFTVFDCFDGSLFDYFREATGITADPPERETRTIGELVEAIWQNRDRDYNVRVLARRLQRIDRELDGAAREELAHFLPEGDLGAFAAELSRRLREQFITTMRLLREPDFQALLQNAARPPRNFLVAYDAQDQVNSHLRIGDLRPEDYLQAFEQFVRENPAEIEAIRILLGRPWEWGTEPLEELTRKLGASPRRFSVASLQHAHQLQFGKALVDLISMVKHAVEAETPLLTAEERVGQAVERVSVGRRFNADQRRWLELIRRHLVATLSLDRADFEHQPLLSRAGGWGRANRVFDGQLAELIKHINEAVAA